MNQVLELKVAMYKQIVLNIILLYKCPFFNKIMQLIVFEGRNTTYVNKHTTYVNKQTYARYLKDLKKESMQLKQKDIRPLFDLNKKSSHLDISRSKNDPAILGPGLVVSPGGNDYSNRYYCQ